MAAADAGRSRARRISLGGILTALVFAAIILAYVSPTGSLAFYTVASLGIAIAVIELGIGYAAVVFAAAGLLCLVYPGLPAAYPLLSLFGPYPLIRALLESRFQRLPAAILKWLAANGLAVLAGLLFAWPLLAGFREKTAGYFWPILIVGSQIILILFDYALGLLITLYMKRFRAARR